MSKGFRKYHLAVCSECGCVEKLSSSGHFIKPFFLPDICEQCGEDMCDSRWSNLPHWRHRIVKEKFVSAIRTKNPLSWLRLGRWEKYDSDEFRA